MKDHLAAACCTWILVLSVCFAFQMEAEDCVVYEGKPSTKNSPTKTMYRQLSTGVLKKGDQFAATLSLTSKNSNEKCDVKILSHTLAVSCSGDMKVYQWSPDIFKEQDITELWVHVGSIDRFGEGGEEDESDSISNELAIIGRRGIHRGHILFPFSRLQPPIYVRWEPMQDMNYYYNCVTGCLYTKSLITPSGTHSFYFRPGQHFNYLSITYNSTEYRTPHELFINSSDVSLDDEWRNLTVVWDDGVIGALIDSKPIKGLGSFSSLSDKSGVEAEIRGGGHLRLCDQRFQEVADGRNDGGNFNNSVQDNAQRISSQEGSDLSNSWLVIVALVCIAFLLLVATVLVFLLLKTKKDLTREREASSRNDIAVASFGESGKGTNRSTAPLYPDAHSGKDTHSGLKGPAAPAPTSNTNPYSFNGTKT